VLLTDEWRLSGRRQVDRLLDGDEAAFEEFFDNYFPALFRFAVSRLGGDEDAAEDVAQAALCRAVARLHTYRGEASLLTWLCTICRHEISAWRESRGKEHAVELREDMPEVRAALESLAQSQGEGPGAMLERAELRRRVHSTLDHLPVHYGKALELKYIEGLSVGEIADRLSVGPKAAESLLTRAREAFRDAFNTLHGGPWPEGKLGMDSGGQR